MILKSFNKQGRMFKAFLLIPNLIYKNNRKYPRRIRINKYPKSLPEVQNNLWMKKSLMQMIKRMSRHRINESFTVEFVNR